MSSRFDLAEEVSKYPKIDLAEISSKMDGFNNDEIQAELRRFRIGIFKSFVIPQYKNLTYNISMLEMVFRDLVSNESRFKEIDDGFKIPEYNLSKHYIYVKERFIWSFVIDFAICLTDCIIEASNGELVWASGVSNQINPVSESLILSLAALRKKKNKSPQSVTPRIILEFNNYAGKCDLETHKSIEGVITRCFNTYLDM